MFKEKQFNQVSIGTDGPYGLPKFLVSSFSKVHRWSMWFALCNAFSPQLFPKVHGWSLCFTLCNAFSP
ncbi:hypothetical protein Hanom_Chr08g00692861 [Helianthus anomalus]